MISWYNIIKYYVGAGGAAARGVLCTTMIHTKNDYQYLSFMICCAGNFEKLDKILYIEKKAAKLNETTLVRFVYGKGKTLLDSPLKTRPDAD